MSFEDQFDKIIRQKAAESDFPFDANNWEKASRMIDADRALVHTTKTSETITTIALVAAAIGIVSLSLIYITTPEITSNKLTPTTTEKTTNTTIQSSELAEITVSVSNDKKIQYKTTVSDKNMIEAGDASVYANTSTLESKVNTVINSTKELATTPSNSSTKLGKTSTLVVQNTIIPSSSRLADINKTNEFIANETNRESADTPSELSTPKTNNSSSTMEANTSSNSETKASVSDVNTATIYNKPITEASKQKSETNALNSEPIMPERVQEELLMVENLNTIQISNSTEMFEQEPKLLPLTMFQRYDEDYYKKGIKYKTHFLNIETGASYLLGWNANGKKDGKGFDWFGGINYGIYITKKIAFGLGVQAYNIKNINQPFYTTEKTDYGFGSIKTTTVITTQSLFYGAVPVKLYYKLNRNHQLATGVNIAYLYRTNTSVTSQQQESAPIVAHNNTIYEMIETINYSLNLSYKLRLSRRFGANVEAVYGLTDIFKGNLQASIIEKPIGLRLSLQYTLFDK